MASEPRSEVEEQPGRVARYKLPGRFRFWVKILPGDEAVDEEILTPAVIRGWSVSFVVHLVVLVTLAFIILKPPPKPPNEINTTLAGDEHGSMLSDQFTGGAGIDEPLMMPKVNEFAPTPQPTLPSIGAIALNPETTPQNKPASGQEGATRTGSGQAGAGDGFGVVRFGHGGENINGVEVKVGDPQFTLIWDSRADLDLHVMEPGGSHLFWEHRDGEQGGELDVDDVDGFGPENIYWGGGIDRGNGPPGQYKWYVHYYGAIGGISIPTRWKVRLKHDGKYSIFEGRFKSIGQQSRTYEFSVGPTSSPVVEEGPDVPTGRHVGGVGRVAEKAPDSLRPAKPEGPPRDDSGWIIYSSPEGGYEVHFPELPSVERRATSTRAGILDLRSASVDRGEGGFSVTYIDYPPGSASDAARFLDEEVVRTIARSGGKLLEKKPLSLDGREAREVTFDVPDTVVAGGGRTRARLIVSGNRLYAVSVTGTAEFLDKGDTDKFFRNFALKQSANRE